MFQFGQPFAFVFAASLVIPVLVHLWRRRKTRTARIGSIRLITGSSKPRSSNRQIRNWPLFLLRCLLIALVTLLLTEPAWNKRPDQAVSGWIIAGPGQWTTIDRQYGKLIDSLRKEGYELRQASWGFPLLDPDDSTTNGRQELSPWSSIRELTGVLPASFPVYLFGDDQLERFTGKRPATDLYIHWLPVRVADTVTSAMRTADPFQIGIWPGNNQTDLPYLMASLRAIAEYTGLEFRIHSFTNAQSSDTLLDCAFVLDPAITTNEIWSSLVNEGSLFRYQGSAVTGASSILTTGVTSLGSATASHAAVLETPVTDPLVNRLPVWKLATGETILGLEQNGSRRVYHFQSLLRPSAGNLVWDGALAGALLPVLFPAHSSNQPDKAGIDSLQVLPDQILNVTNLPRKGADERLRLDRIIWVIALFLLAIERIVSYKQHRHAA